MELVVRFELTMGSLPLVYKTSAIDRSATPAFRINNYMNLLEIINTFSGIIAIAVLFIAIAKIFQ